MKILLATTNPHKLREIRQVISSPLINWVLLSDLPQVPAEPHEDQPTFEGNALLKARYYAQHSGLWTLADDSGLEVDALDNAPGVHSARYSGQSGPREKVDRANNRRLLAELAQQPDAGERHARFVCAMALVSPDRRAPRALVRGCVHGRILKSEETSDPEAPEYGRGEYGFGYDPLFELTEGPWAGRTAAELTSEEKNSLSHRGAAARLLWTKLRPLIPEAG